MRFAEALLARNQFAFADILLKAWNTDTVVWNTHPERDIGSEFPCEDCEELDGKHFDLTNLPDRPHFGCNCTLNDAKTGEELSGLEMFMRVDTGHRGRSSVRKGATHSGVAKYNHQHKPTGPQGGQFTSQGGGGDSVSGKPNHNPATRQPWPTRPDLDINGPDKDDPGYVPPTHDLDTPPDARVGPDPDDAHAAPAKLPVKPEAQRRATGNDIIASHRRSNPNETNNDNKRLNDLISQGVTAEGEQAWGGRVGTGEAIDAATLKNQVTTELARRSGLSYERTNEFVATWAGSSSDTQPDSIALQMAAAAQFNVDPGPFMKAQADMFAAAPQSNMVGQPGYPHGWAPRMADATKFIAAMYKYTQDTLAERGITSVTAYRGIGFDEFGPLIDDRVANDKEELVATVRAYAAAAASKGDSTLDHNPITSWSTDAGQAVQFARSQDNGGGAFVLSAEIPASRILSTAATGIGCQDEQELTIVGGYGRSADKVDVRQLQSATSASSLGEYGHADVHNAYDDTTEYNPTAGVDLADQIPPLLTPEDAAALHVSQNPDVSWGPVKPPKPNAAANAYAAMLAHDHAVPVPAYAQQEADLDAQVAAAVASDPGGRIVDGKLETDNPGAALQAMWMGVRVQLDQPRQISTLLGLLHDQAVAAKAAGKNAGNIDLNLLSVRGTNLFTEGAVVGKRIDMPQLATKEPVPGSTADQQPRNANGEVDMVDAYVQSLIASGTKVTNETEQAAYLRATQGEVGGMQVAGIMTEIQSGSEKGRALAEGGIVVSRDNYILDGHHRWAAMVGVDSADGILGNGTPMNVRRVDAGILDILESAQAFADEMGLPNVEVGHVASPKLKDGLLVPAQHQRLPQRRVITAAEARGNSRPVSAEEFHALADEGDRKLATMREHSSEPTALQVASWESIKRSAYNAVQPEWGGATVNAHTGETVPEGASLFALSAKEPYQESVSIPTTSTYEQFSTAMDIARTHFAPQLAMQGAHLGVFHDADPTVNAINIDPTIVVGSVHEVEAIGAATHAIGGAYDFSTGNGVFPPHVADLMPTSSNAMSTGPKGFIPSATDVQTANARATMAEYGITSQEQLDALFADMRAAGAAQIEKMQALGVDITVEKAAGWYPFMHDAANLWIDHSYSPLVQAALIAATTAKTKWSYTIQKDSPYFKKGTTVYGNLTAAASCASYVADNPVLPVTREDAYRINAVSYGWNPGAPGKPQEQGLTGHVAAGVDMYGNKPMASGQQEIRASVDDDGNALLDEQGQPIVIHANDMSDQQLGKYISMAGNAIVPGVNVGYPDSLARGVAIARGASPWVILKGPKEQSFLTNIAYPYEKTTSTIDSHMGNGMLGKHFPKVPLFNKDGSPKIDRKTGKQAVNNTVESFVSNPGGYKILSDTVINYARTHGDTIPNAEQAVGWMSDMDLKMAASFGGSMPERPFDITNESSPPNESDSDELQADPGFQLSTTITSDDIASTLPTPSNAMATPGRSPAQQEAIVRGALAWKHEPHDAQQIYDAEEFLRSKHVEGQMFTTQEGAQDYVAALMTKYAPGLDPSNYPAVKYVNKLADPGDIAETTWPNSPNGQPEMHDIVINLSKAGHNQLSLIHETAHVITVNNEGQFLSPHGAAFRRAYGAMLAGEMSQAGANLGQFAKDYFPPEKALGKSVVQVAPIASKDVVATITVGGKTVVVCYGGSGNASAEDYTL